MSAITRFMRPVNFLGAPSLVVPAGHSESGLPIGLQLIGRPFGDETLMALGRAFQAATDHHQRVPQPPMNPIVDIRDLHVRFTGERTVTRSTVWTSHSHKARCWACSASRVPARA